MRLMVCCAVVMSASGLRAQMEMGAQQQSIGSNQSVMAAILQPVTGEPYQAQKVSRSVQTLADGTVITHESKGVIARDAEGRMREEMYIVHSGNVGGKQQNLTLQSATVGDPVAHTVLFWTDETTKTAMQMQLPSLPKGAGMGALMAAPPPAPPPPPAGSALPGGTTKTVRLGSAGLGAKDESRTEDLGQQSMEGVLVTGKRTTTTIATGEVGNDRPILVTHEEWRSPELKIVVKTMDSDPRSGQTTMELTTLVRTDPDASLFQAPAGYKVQDMAQMMKGLSTLGQVKVQ